MLEKKASLKYFPQRLLIMEVKNRSDKNIFPVFGMMLPRHTKEIYLRQKSKVIWLTGLSGSGKTLLASMLEKKLFKLNYFCQILDGDNIRSGLNENLGFTEEDRFENIRRIAEAGKLFLDCGIICICAFISPTHKIRQLARNIIGKDDFLEIFVDTPLEVCELRDSKGLYKKARRGELNDFTGISAPYEPPEDPFLRVNNTKPDPARAVNQMLIHVLPEICRDPLPVDERK